MKSPAILDAIKLFGLHLMSQKFKYERGKRQGTMMKYWKSSVEYLITTSLLYLLLYHAIPLVWEMQGAPRSELLSALAFPEYSLPTYRSSRFSPKGEEYADIQTVIAFVGLLFPLLAVPVISDLFRIDSYQEEYQRVVDAIEKVRLKVLDNKGGEVSRVKILGMSVDSVESLLRRDILLALDIWQGGSTLKELSIESDLKGINNIIPSRRYHILFLKLTGIAILFLPLSLFYGMILGIVNSHIQVLYVCFVIICLLLLVLPNVEAALREVVRDLQLDLSRRYYSVVRIIGFFKLEHSDCFQKSTKVEFEGEGGGIFKGRHNFLSLRTCAYKIRKGFYIAKYVFIIILLTLLFYGLYPMLYWYDAATYGISLHDLQTMQFPLTIIHILGLTVVYLILLIPLFVLENAENSAHEDRILVRILRIPCPSNLGYISFDSKVHSVYANSYNRTLIRLLTYVYIAIFSWLVYKVTGLLAGSDNISAASWVSPLWSSLALFFSSISLPYVCSIRDSASFVLRVKEVLQDDFQSIGWI